MRRLPPSVLDEYFCVALLAPLLGTDIRADYCETLYTSDASLTGQRGRGGVCTTPLPAACVERLYRHRVRPGNKGFRRLEEDPITEIDEFLGILDDQLVETIDPRWFGDVADAASWSFLASYEMGERRHHITRYEMAAARTAVRAAAKACRPGRSHRVVIGIDCDPVVYGVVKGRSSRKLNIILRRLAAEQLFCGLYLGVLRVPSLQNPADAPSRRERVRRGPVACPASWARDFINGDPDALELAPILRVPRVGQRWLDELPRFS